MRTCNNYICNLRKHSSLLDVLLGIASYVYYVHVCSYVAIDHKTTSSLKTAKWHPLVSFVLPHITQSN